jgi:hypothetical protein
MTVFEIDDTEFRRVSGSVAINEFIQKPVSVKVLGIMLRMHIDIQKKGNLNISTTITEPRLVPSFTLSFTRRHETNSFCCII